MNALPEIQLKSSAAVKTTLTFGDPDDVSSRELLRIPVNMYKLTSKVSPMSQTKLSKVAQESAAGKREWERMLQSQSQAGPSSVPSLPPPPQEEDDMPTYLVDRKMNHYLTDALFNSEDGTAEPLAEDTEFEKAYKLGATLVPVSEDMLQRLQTKKGLEIIQFVHASTVSLSVLGALQPFRSCRQSVKGLLSSNFGATRYAQYAREYHFGEVYYVFAEPGSQKAQIQLSSVVKALSETDELALVRLVQRDEGEPKVSWLPLETEIVDLY